MRWGCWTSDQGLRKHRFRFRDRSVNSVRKTQISIPVVCSVVFEGFWCIHGLPILSEPDKLAPSEAEPLSGC